MAHARLNPSLFRTKPHSSAFSPYPVAPSPHAAPSGTGKQRQEDGTIRPANPARAWRNRVNHSFTMMEGHFLTQVFAT